MVTIFNKSSAVAEMGIIWLKETWANQRTVQWGLTVIAASVHGLWQPFCNCNYTVFRKKHLVVFCYNF